MLLYLNILYKIIMTNKRAIAPQCQPALDAERVASFPAPSRAAYSEATKVLNRKLYFQGRQRENPAGKPKTTINANQGQ